MERLKRKAPVYAAIKDKIAYINIGGYVSLYKCGNIIILVAVIPIITPILGPIANLNARFNTGLFFISTTSMIRYV